MSTLQIVHYPHPALRWKSKDVTRIDAQLKEWINQMFELMYEARGIGLAANQVALPYRLFVINPSGDPEQPEFEQVFINPEILRRNGSEEAEEGCLSLPKIFGSVNRAERIVVEAFDVDGQNLRFELTGMEARIVQHENDHLDGVIFTEKVNADTLSELQPQLNEMTAQFTSGQESGEIEPTEQLTVNLRKLEAERTG